MLAVLTFSCTEAVKSNSSDVESEQHTDSDTASVAQFYLIESQIIDTIWSLPEVIKRNDYVDSASNHTRKLTVYIQDEPNVDNDSCYIVKASEDNGENMVSHFMFSVSPNSMEIMYYDVMNDENLTLERWRKFQPIKIKEIWDNRLSKMSDKDKAKKIDLFHFPLEGDYGYSMELKGDVDQWTKSEFYNNYDKFFTEDVLSKIEQTTYFDLDLLDAEDEVVVSLTLDFIYLIGEYQADSSIMFYAKEYDGAWKIYKILMAG